MTVINAVQIFILLWGFTSVCQTDAGQCGIRCNDVNGTVGIEMILACSVCKQPTTDCVDRYKFLNGGSEIYKEVFPEGVCEKRSIFIRRYTPDKAMNGTFSFFVQVGSCTETKDFTVKISEPVKPIAGGRTGDKPPKPDPGQVQPIGSVGSAVSAISAGVGCCIIFILIIILTIIIIYKKHRDACQEKTFQVVAQKDDDN